MKRILIFIGDALLFVFAVTTFTILVSALTLGAILLVDVVGKWIGIGNDIFIYAAWFVVFMKTWDFLAWVIGKMAEREERKKSRTFTRDRE